MSLGTCTSVEDDFSAHDGGSRNPGNRSTQQPSVSIVDLVEARQFQRMYRAILRGGLIGLIGRGGLHSSIALISIFRKRPSGAHGLAVRDTLRWSAFLAAFGGVFVGADEFLRLFMGVRRKASLSSSASVMT